MWLETEQKVASRIRLLENASSLMNELLNQLNSTQSWLERAVDKISQPVPLTLSIDDLNQTRKNHEVSSFSN